MEPTELPSLNIKALAMGLAAMLALDVVWGVAVFLIWPGSGAGTPADVSALYLQPAYLAVALILGTSTTAMGGAVCARWAPVLPYWHVAAFGVLSISVGLLLSDPTQPVWFTVLATLLTLPAAIYGGHVALKPGRKKPVP
jgi:hypothetical protein